MVKQDHYWDSLLKSMANYQVPTFAQIKYWLHQPTLGVHLDSYVIVLQQPQQHTALTIHPYLPLPPSVLEMMAWVLPLTSSSETLTSKSSSRRQWVGTPTQLWLVNTPYSVTEENK